MLEEHISDESIHGKARLTTNVVNSYTTNITVGGDRRNDGALTRDTVKYLPISLTAAEINAIIRETPHDLNGFTLIFLFVVPDDYVEEEAHEYVCDVKGSYIDFHNFRNGTLVILGDQADETGSIVRKSKDAIRNPVVFDSVNMRRFVADFESSMESPSPIGEIIRYEDEADAFNVGTYNKITIAGTALNESFSVMALYDIQAKTYVKNLKFRSTVRPVSECSNELSVSYSDSQLPSEGKALLFYPLDDGRLAPKVGGTLQDYLNGVRTNVDLKEAYGAHEGNLKSADALSSIVFGEVVPSIQRSIDGYGSYGRP